METWVQLGWASHIWEARKEGSGDRSSSDMQGVPGQPGLHEDLKEEKNTNKRKLTKSEREFKISY